MFQIKNVTLTHKKDLRTIIEDFSLVLNDGDRVVMIGEEGNGKSTLMKWIIDPGLVEDYIEGTGEKMTGGEKPGYLPQELPECDRDKTVYEYFDESDGFRELTPKELSGMAGDFGVKPDFYYREQTMRTLSGGERVKAQMMRILTERPTILLLDEPTRNFSPLSGSVIRKMIGEFPGAVISVSHDRKYLYEVCDRILELTPEGLRDTTESFR